MNTIFATDFKFHVLWVEDDDAIVTSKRDVAAIYDIDLCRVSSWEEARELLDADLIKGWTAVVLDCNCRLERQASTKSTFLPNAISDFIDICTKNHIELPYYVLSGGEAGGIVDFKSMIASCEYKRKPFNDKWGDFVYIKGHEEKLWKNIVNFGREMPRNKVRGMYQGVFSFLDTYCSPCSDIMEELLICLHFPEQGAPINQYLYYNKLRTIIEHLYRYLNKVGIIPDDVIWKGNNIVNIFNCNRYLSYIPHDLFGYTPIQYFDKDTAYFLLALINVCNEASHSGGDAQTEYREIERYSFFSNVLKLCSIVLYVQKNNDSSNFKTEKDPDIIRIDEKAQRYCGKYKLTNCNNLINAKVKLRNKRINNGKDSATYPFIADGDFITNESSIENIKNEENRILREWHDEAKSNWINSGYESRLFKFTYDGILCRGEVKQDKQHNWYYERSNECELWFDTPRNKRLLILTKDVPNGENGDDIRTWTGRVNNRIDSVVEPHFFRNLMSWCYAIKNISEGNNVVSFDEIKDEELIRNFDTMPLARINCKKQPGSYTCPTPELVEYMDIYKEHIKKQINFVDAGIVFCGGGESSILKFLQNNVFDDLCETSIRFPGKEDKYIYYSKAKDTIVIDGYHPSYYGKDAKEMYDEVAYCFEQFYLQKKSL